MDRTAAQVKKTPDHYVIDPDGDDLLVGTVVGMPGVVVSATSGAVGPDFFYVQADNRTAGIRVEGSTAGLDVGDVVDVIGIVMTDGVEREVRFPIVQAAGMGGVGPLFMCNSSVGGTTDGPALGVTDALGPNNVGVLVRVSGQVTASSGSEFVLTDGSTANGITCRASAGITIPETGFAIVTGVVSLEEIGSAREVVILIRDQQDIQ